MAEHVPCEEEPRYNDGSPKGLGKEQTRKLPNTKSSGEDGSKTMMWLQITVAVLVVLLAVSAGYGYSKHYEVELLKSKNEKLLETKGRCDAREMFIAEKQEAVKQSSVTHIANTDRLMDMLKSAQDSLAMSRGDSVKKEEQCSKQLNELQREFSSLHENITELIRKKERVTMQVNLYSEKLQACKASLRHEEAKLAECKRQYNRCWWC